MSERQIVTLAVAMIAALGVWLVLPRQYVIPGVIGVGVVAAIELWRSR